MANIRPKDLPSELTPSATDVTVIDGTTTRKATLTAIVNAGRPLANQTEAEAGVEATKAMTPLTVAQAIAAQGGAAFATVAQGAKADAALPAIEVAGGTVGQVLAKASAADNDFVWSNTGAGDVLAVNNLSDLDDDAIARTNLGVAIGTNVQAWDATLDSLAANDLGNTGLELLADATADDALTTLGFSTFWKTLVGVASYAAAWLLLKVLGSLPTRTLLKAIAPSTDMAVTLTESGRAGLFVWRTGDYSAKITADTQEGIYIKADSVASTTGAWVRHYDGYVNIKWFGATGVALNDATPAFTAAFATMERGETLYLPAGRYDVTSGFTFTSTNRVNIIGDDKFYSIIYAVGFASDAAIFTFSGTTGARIQDIYWRNFSLWSDNNLARGITATWINKSLFDNIYFNSLRRGVVGDNAWSNVWRNISAQSITVDLFLLQDQCNNTHFDRCEFRGASGIQVTGSGAGLKFTGCNIEGITSVSGYGINIAPTTGKTFRSVTIDTCYFETIAGTAIRIAPADVGAVSGVKILGNYIYAGTSAPGATGIVLSGVNAFDIIDNDFLGWTSQAIFRTGETNGLIARNSGTSGMPLTNTSDAAGDSVQVVNNWRGRKEWWATAMPATGTFTAGDIVWNRNALTKDVSNMVILGWGRSTTGSAHVAGTDWQVLRASHVSPAT